MASGAACPAPFQKISRSAVVKQRISQNLTAHSTALSFTLLLVVQRFHCQAKFCEFACFMQATLAASPDASADVVA